MWKRTNQLRWATSVLVLVTILGTIQWYAWGDATSPAITIVSMPTDDPGPTMASNDIKGTVSGVKPDDYKVVIYAFGDVWYVQPYAASPLTDISSDNTWDTQTHGGTQFAALLVKPSYQPPATLASLPKVGGDVVAIDKKTPQK
jgi:hypothetical protein